MKKIAITLVLIGCAVGLVSGCGSSSSDSGSSSLNRKQFVKQGNTACEKGFKKVASAIALVANRGEVKASQNKQLVEAVVPAYRDMFKAIRDLGAPKGQGQKIAALLAAYEKQFHALEANPDLASSGKPVFKKANKLAESYGLTSCEI